MSRNSLLIRIDSGLSDGREPLLQSGMLLSHRSLVPNSTSQVAIVGANVCPIESLDYEIAENEVFNQDWRARGKLEIFQYTFMKWLLCFLLGMIVSVIGFINNLTVENISGIKLVTVSSYMMNNRFFEAYMVFVASNLVLSLLASSITVAISPVATGSGIPEVKAYLNGVDAPGIFTLRTLFVKVVGSIFVSSSSLFIGKAGPLVHTGACVASLLSQGGSKKYKLTSKLIRYFKNDRDRRDLVTCGSAAGIAAAFRAPVGGLMFAFDEMASWWRSSLLWRTFFTTALVGIVLRSLITICDNGNCGIFGRGGLIMFDINSSSVTYSFEDIPSIIVIAIVGGVLGSFYNFVLIKVVRMYNQIYEKGNFYKIFIGGFISFLTSSLIFCLSFLAKCQSCPADAAEQCPTVGHSGNYKKFQCPSKQYNDLASLFFNTNDDAIKNLFSENTEEEFHYTSLIIFLVASFFLSILDYGVVSPSGLFIPGIVIGASYGRLVGKVFGTFSRFSNGLNAVLGAAAFLGGSVKTSVSLCVIILELTNNLLLLPFVMLALLVSKTVGDMLNGSLYDLIMKAKGLPYLESHAEPYMRQLTVADVVSGPLYCFQGVEKVRNVVTMLRASGHNGFPVVDDGPAPEGSVLYGLILRAHLIVVLKKKGFSASPRRARDDAMRDFTADEFAKRGSGNGEKIEDLTFTEEELEMFVDLHPFCNASPYTVVESMSLAKALTLFRDVGLRHMLVIPKAPSTFPVVGILTRHDFLPEYVLGLHPHLAKSKTKRLRIRFPGCLKFF